jgi:hypothetical protein
MSLQLQPVQVATGSSDHESQLVFSDGFLVAVLVRLSDQHEEVWADLRARTAALCQPRCGTSLDQAAAQRGTGSLMGPGRCAL